MVSIITSKRKRRRFISCVYLFVLALLPWQQAWGQAAPLAAYEADLETWNHNRQSRGSSLFTDQEVLQLKLVVNYQKLLKDRGDERSYHTGTLSYLDSVGAVVTLPLKVMVRGNRRRDPRVCRFPPLMLNFIRKAMPEGTIFEGQNKVKLVTHCIGDEFVLREYLVYKVYNLLTEQSYRVRLCQVEYADSLGKRKTEQHYAFMIESDKEMASRSEAKFIPKKRIVRMERTDQRVMARLALFQYMMGNTDWSVPFRHNIDLLATDSLAPAIPVPFDFDYAGMVAAPYATPPPELGIKSVKQRLYRGYSFPENIHQETINTFNSLRTPIYALYRQCEPLSRAGLKQSLKYLDNFYRIINDPRKFKREILKVGERNEREYVAVIGLEKKKR